ncbi:MAG: UDP-2,3-diacylglucosamine diphosphatase LpxI [Deltaproteobacteria bacterium]|nr:UDP-2,3-diacylglucosamine diphosphatase LpxI [Deltaproteobacteria bacterium]MBW1912419.1 UDP-2,3-diacylglucosamine diphosphatase LpxI [Deltaproteobacteria bacterium]
MTEGKDSIGIIAGGGKFPFLVADSARKQGIRVVAVAHQGETDPALANSVDQIAWVKLGQLGRLIRAFKENGVRKALMAGSITKQRMFSNVRPDLKGVSLISRVAIFHDDGILKALADELAKEGIEIISSTAYLPDLLAMPGCLSKRRPSKSEREDIRFGWDLAKELGRLDAGQCVVVRRKTVLALEAIDGTNETILRGGRLAGENAVVVKVSKPNQDMRFDVPSVGLETVRVMSEVKAAVLAIEAGKTLMFDREEMIEYANKAGLSIVSQ